jgi:methionyl aminopeptidase
MGLIKTQDEIVSMKKGGALLSEAIKTAVEAAAPGVKLKELDKIAEEVIVEGGGKPSFKNYQSSPGGEPFPSTLCISVNDELVHGLGNRDIALKEGDIVSLDCGVWHDDLCTDMAVTVPIGEVSDEAKTLMRVTREALDKAVAAVKPGARISDVGRAVESVVKPHGYGIVRSLVGHGVGHAVHEPPQIPNFVDKRIEDEEFKEGMCVAIEPMLGLKGWGVETKADQWTIAMQDGALSAHFEQTIAVQQDGAEILTPTPV